MKRFIAGAFATALLVTGLTMTASPASAAEVCAGVGLAATGPVFYPVTPASAPGLAPSASGGVTFNFTVGACVVSGAGSVGGSFTANAVGNYCGHSTGTVSVPTAGSLSWVSAGSVLALTGAGGGVVVAVPDAVSGQSCVTGATSFRVAGAVASA